MSRIFSAFPLQEVAVLAERSDQNDTVARSLELIADPEDSLEARSHENEALSLEERALIM